MVRIDSLLRRLCVGIVTTAFLGGAMTVDASTWSSLPDAVNRLQSTPGNPAAEQVLREAEVIVAGGSIKEGENA